MRRIVSPSHKTVNSIIVLGYEKNLLFCKRTNEINSLYFYIMKAEDIIDRKPNYRTGPFQS